MSMRFTTLKEFTYPHWAVIPAERRKHFKKIDHTQGNIYGIISPFLVPTVREEGNLIEWNTLESLILAPCTHKIYVIKFLP